MSRSMLFAEHAFLPDGWRRDVLLRWDAHGMLTEVRAGVPYPPGAPRARGPLAPGMPNLHSHAFQRAMAGLTEYRAQASDSFWSWRDLMYRFALRVSPDALEAIARWLYIEMLKCGYTSVCEFHYLHRAPDGSRYARHEELARRLIGAAAGVGIGLTMLPVSYQYSGFGERAARDDQRRFVESIDGMLSLLATLRSALPEHGGLRYGIAPHSLRAVSESGLRALLDGLPADAPVHIHIAEQMAEVDDCLRSYDARPVRWLLERFAVDARWCLVHATHLDAGEIAALAASGAVAGLCPTTEANLGDGLFPAVDYLARRGAIGIGSDSHASVDWRAELRLLEYGQRLFRRERNVLASPAHASVADALFVASLDGGARASGRRVGALAAGRRADWIVFDPEHPSLIERGSEHWLSSVVFAEHGETPVLDVYTGGERVVEGRRHRDESEAYAGYRRALSDLHR